MIINTWINTSYRASWCNYVSTFLTTTRTNQWQT